MGNVPDAGPFRSPFFAHRFMPRPPALPSRFLAHLQALGLVSTEVHLLVAVSGGCDSVVLFHLLRFHATPGTPRISAAHFDHAMRPDSAADAAWVQGLCRAWGVPLVVGRAETQLRSEQDARRARHRFLRSAARELDATHIATAHHADDQAETVLFRILRGTGLQGLAGIAPVSPTGVVRPLLPFWRQEVERFARTAGLRWRNDPTNRSLGPVRNRIRHVVLPQIEQQVAPSARRSLVRLAELAGETEASLAALVESLERSTVSEADGTVMLARQPFREYHPALASRLLRRVLRRFGCTLTGAGTRIALQFITDAPSGRQLQLPGGLRLTTEFDRLRVAYDASPGTDATLLIPAAQASGSGAVCLGGRHYRVFWSHVSSPPEPHDPHWRAGFDPGSLTYPLHLRSWSPGDRIRLHAGSRRLKRLFGDRRVPRTERSRIPLLVGADGVVHWVAGVVQSPESQARPGQDALFIALVHG
jgi:tRNA(Ile)-lysidine synthase